MAERANLADEKERQRHMRLAEFFASWGSTPGPVLVAGMNALKQSIPGIISDEKEAKKARKEADKIIYDIDEATRLEKQGMHKKLRHVERKLLSTLKTTTSICLHSSLSARAIRERLSRQL
jgi:replication-associated recombination protein RarA